MGRLSRLDAAPLATDFVLTMKQVADCYTEAGNSRAIRNSTLLRQGTSRQPEERDGARRRGMGATTAAGQCAGASGGTAKKLNADDLHVVLGGMIVRF